ncbi:LysR family transcriptional regulator [Paenibacillus thailandensis]|uniref:LysR family transcriptional regulator n=1 Tax=Paenibacillus thailandensis TaxID=393250 RepID=A0ABW5R5H9_9BACL
MDIRQLRYFLEIAQTGQITRAAKNLNMEQPPLSRQLKLMEEELNVTLFDRNGKRLQLTSAGELLRERAERLLRELGETVQAVKEVNEGITGELAIGSVVSCISLLPPHIKSFREKYPLMTFKIAEGDHFLLGDQLEKRNIELIVARLPFEAADEEGRYEELRLPSDPYVAVIPSQWKSDAEQKSITMGELAAFPFLTLKTDKTTGMHERVVKEFREHGHTPHIICECSSVAIIMAMVAQGIGVTVFPKSVMDSFPLSAIAMLEISDASFLSEVGVVWLKNRYLSRGARRFIELFREAGGRGEP